MDIKLIAVSILTVIEAILGLIVFLHDSRKTSNRLFVFFVLSIIFWTISNYTADLLSSLVWTKLTYIASVLIFYIFLLLAEDFPSKLYPINRRLKFFFHCAALILIVLFSLPVELLVKGIRFYPGGVDVITGPFFPAVSLFFLFSLVHGFYLLIEKLRHSERVEKVQLEYFILGFLVSFVFGVVANLIIPTITGSYESSQYGPFGLVFFLLLTTFAIVRFNLFNITIIATEVFAAMLILLLATQAFLATTVTHAVSSYAVLILAIILTFFLVRSMLREVKQKEELERLSKRLEDTNQELKRLDETKSEFVSIASHQLRTPLTVIKGYLSMLQEESFGKIPVKQQEPLEKVYESANRLIELVENLLSVSRIESGRMKYNFEPVQMEDMVASVADELSSNAKKKKLNLEYVAPKTALPKINIDQDKIRQVMMNLVDNAIKYTKRGTVTVSIRKESGEAGSRVLVPSLVFEVKDTGNGVRPDDKDRLFQKFIRGQGSSLVHTEGTGLGLYVGRMMVEAHGGNIWVESKGEGLGSTFAFALPLVRPGEAKSASANFETLVKGL